MRKRVEDLVVLPVFYKLKAKKVVLAGGTDAAAWKGELLAAAGAHVHIYAEELDEAFDAILRARPDKFTHHRRPWGQHSFEHATLAIADAETDGGAHAFYCAARAAGVPVNVIDNPKYCEFQFGSIVNRSPAIVGISTDGAAPILGQAIRRRVETALPSFLTEWAQLAAKIRSQVNERFEMGASRRAFWERFVDKTFAGPPAAKNEQHLLNTRDDAPQKGKVTLVGAGPGDAEFLTLKAMRALQAADVILFDDLVSDEVLELARREAKRMLVGKRGGRVSCKQEEINDMMVTFAKAGKNVVRLKSGDPSIFGRAGEEIEHLERLQIPVSVVPGITSASAMAAQLGVSLTHRDHAQSVRFVTGHSRQGKLPEDIDWKSIAAPNTTTIFYMGGRTASQIADRLMREGMSVQTPVAVCASVSRTDGITEFTTLSNLADTLGVVGVESPVLIGVGAVFRSRQGKNRLPVWENAALEAVS
ncbi:MAG: siroheme synthase CysG [Pseudomonadota bacterium]